ncbi:Abhydrolase domain protein [Fusarium beomiforme]|uniref:Abhydrolase domain protein n=1 Tax=Fusarium beomiforme TaxID=44412 RepID=A0A9P5A7W8_9HYPO|nr:Abhydrolase domain protein [Fusarium beomiforme]
MQQSGANLHSFTQNGNFKIYVIGSLLNNVKICRVKNHVVFEKDSCGFNPSGWMPVPAGCSHKYKILLTDSRDLGRYVYALDLRNHGESPHSNKHDYSLMAQDVAEFIEGHGLKETTLIGHSMGAKTSMALALHSPDLVADIVAVDNAPVDVALSRDFPKYVRAMKKIQEANVTRQAEADKILSEYEESLSIRQFLLGNMYQPEGEKVRKFRIPLDTLGKSLDNLGDFPYKNPNEVRFVKPALFVRGTKSKYVPDDVLPLIGQFFPKFRLVDIDAGHWVISEQPEAFRQAVIEFLQKPE